MSAARKRTQPCEAYCLIEVGNVRAAHMPKLPFQKPIQRGPSGLRGPGALVLALWPRWPISFESKAMNQVGFFSMLADHLRRAERHGHLSMPRPPRGSLSRCSRL